MHRHARTWAGAVLAAAALSAPWVVPSASGSGADTADPVAGELASATTDASRIALAGPRPQTLNLKAPDTGARRVRVLLVGGGARTPVRTWDLGPLAPHARRSLRWDARDRHGRPAPEGPYRFLAAVDGGPVAPVARPFEVVRGFFPVRGPHRFGDGLGADRGHQGQDVVAPCGTPVVAARGGRVRETGSDGVRGHYVVVDPAGGWSTAYLHLQRPPLVASGAQVVTGQPLGLVGTTGHSSGCHLHFELWSPPGYWRGEPVDAGRALRRWDAATGAGRLVR